MSSAAAKRYPVHLKVLIYGFIALWVIMAAFPFSGPSGARSR